MAKFLLISHGSSICSGLDMHTIPLLPIPLPLLTNPPAGSEAAVDPIVEFTAEKSSQSNSNVLSSSSPVPPPIVVEFIQAETESRWYNRPEMLTQAMSTREFGTSLFPQKLS